MIGRIFRNRWVRRVGLSVFILVLLVVVVLLNAHFSIKHKGEQHRDSVIAGLDATDPGWRWESIEAARKKDLPPAEKNVIEQAVKLHDRFPKDGYAEWAKADTSTHQRRPGEMPSADELTHARQLVEVCRELIPEARGLRHLSGGVVVTLAENPYATLLPHAQKPREVAVLLQADALVSAADGRPDDALDDALTILAMARGLEDEPFLVCQLVRLALTSVAARSVERTLWLGEPSDAKLAEVQAALTAAAKVPGFITALKGERAGANKTAAFLEKDPGQVVGLLNDGNGKPPPKAAAVVVSTLLPETEARYLELMTRAIEIAQKPPGPERDVEFAQIEKDVAADQSLEGQGVKLLFPAVAKCYTADVRGKVVLLAAAAAVGAERHRLKTGTFPTELTDPPTDPFTAKPILLKATDDGIVIHSAGPAPGSEAEKRVKSGSDWTPEKDLGVRLFDPKHRQKKAEEVKP